MKEKEISLEVIRIRCFTVVEKDNVINYLKRIKQFRERGKSLKIELFTDTGLETDLAILIHWKSDEVSRTGSPLGYRINEDLQSYGLTNHNVWIKTEVPDFNIFP